ncbi:MAG: DUF167 domain-containing protein [Deltaproteobacteria bacterium]|nr:DUF167 domain-containing protein [Deltaproteobacteria bacterium]
MEPFYCRTTEGLRLAALVQPRSARNEIAGPIGGRLKIKLTAPPVEGRANQALVRFLAKKLNLAPSRIKIVAGRKSRRKEVIIEGLGVEDFLKAISGP